MESCLPRNVIPSSTLWTESIEASQTIEAGGSISTDRFHATVTIHLIMMSYIEVDGSKTMNITLGGNNGKDDSNFAEGHQKLPMESGPTSRLVVN